MAFSLSVGCVVVVPVAPRNHLNASNHTTPWKSAAVSSAIALLLCFYGTTVRAEILAHYSFDENDYDADPSNRIGANTSLDLLNKAVPVVGVTASEILFSPGIDPSAALGFAADDYDGALGFSADVNDDRNFATTGQSIFFQLNVQDGATMSLEALEFVSLKTRGDNATGSRVDTHHLCESLRRSRRRWADRGL